MKLDPDQAGLLEDFIVNFRGSIHINDSVKAHKVHKDINGGNGDFMFYPNDGARVHFSVASIQTIRMSSNKMDIQLDFRV